MCIDVVQCIMCACFFYFYGLTERPYTYRGGAWGLGGVCGDDIEHGGVMCVCECV